jgi:hypothetical protein
MSNMTVNQRNQEDRAMFAGSSERIRRGSERGALIYNVIAFALGVGLSAVAVTTIEGWAQWLVLGVIVLTTIGFMIAISPNRRGW